ncbi:MAG: helix-turn-helix domain-containing protein [Cyanophyceae cyanobacterium]
MVVSEAPAKQARAYRFRFYPTSEQERSGSDCGVGRRYSLSR